MPNPEISLAELLPQIAELMPAITLPPLGRSMPVSRMSAALHAAGLLVEANDQLLAAYKTLHAAYQVLEIHYYHPSGALLVSPDLLLNPIPEALAALLGIANADGFEAMKEGLAADRRRKPFGEAIDRYNSSAAGTAQMERIIGLLRAGCDALKWAVISLSALARAFQSAGECRRQILLYQERSVVTEETPQEAKARREILASHRRHQQVVAAVASLSVSK